MKKILLFLTIIASTFVYSQNHAMTMHRTHARMAQQAMNQHQNFMNLQMMRSSSLSTLDVLKNKVNKKTENLHTKLHKEEKKLVELQNIENTNSDALKIEKQVDKATKKIEKIKSDVIFQDEKKTKYKNQISELELKITEKEAKRRKKKEKIKQPDSEPSSEPYEFLKPLPTRED